MIALALSLSTSITAQTKPQAPPTPISICSLLRNPLKFDGKSIVVTGQVEASMEAVVIHNPKCGGMYLSGTFEDQSDLGKKLDDAIITRTGGFDIKILTTVEGVFHAKIPYGKKTILQLEVTHVRDVQLTGTQQAIPAKKP